MATAMLTAHRVTGTVPAQFHFDITRDTTIAAMLQTGRNFWADHFEWNFGDGSAETFATSGLSSNTATGPVASYVYRAAGSYTVTLTMVRCGGSGVTPIVYKFTQSLTVSAFSGTELYVDSAASDDSGNGLTPETAKQTLPAGLTLLFAANGPRRLNVKAGGTYSYSSTTTPARTGTFLIEPYGAGDDPVITTTAAFGMIDPPQTGMELIVRGLDVTGNNGDPQRIFLFGENSLYIDCTMRDCSHGLFTDDVDGNRNYNCVWNCTIEDVTRYGIYYNYGGYNAIVGCTFNTISDATDGEHFIRCYTTHSCINHCNFIGTMRSAKHALKFVGYYPTGHVSREGDELTEMVEYCSITDNYFAATLACNWQAVIGPIDATGNSDQRHQYVLYERNWHDCGTSSSQVGLFFGCNYNCVRNNVIDGSGAGAPGTCTGIRVSIRGAEPAPTDNIVANNTGWRSDAAAMRTVQVVAASVTTYCYNNCAQSSTGADALSDAGTGTVNSGDVQGTNLRFTNAAAGDFTLADGSSLFEAGTVVASVYRDRAGLIRTRATNDTGAYTDSTDTEQPETSLGGLSISTPILLGADFL